MLVVCLCVYLYFQVWYKTEFQSALAKVRVDVLLHGSLPYSLGQVLIELEAQPLARLAGQ